MRYIGDGSPEDEAEQAAFEREMAFEQEMRVQRIRERTARYAAERAGNGVFTGKYRHRSKPIGDEEMREISSRIRAWIKRTAL